MAARSAWSGAIEFAGFPIHVKAYSLTKSKSADSFKTIAPNGSPVKQLLVDSDGTVVDRDACGKGVEVAKGQFTVLPPEAVEAINEAERSVTLKVDRFSPRASVPLHLATGHYRIVPDEKIAGSAGPVGILWNGLLKTNRVLVTEWTPRSGSRSALLVVHADQFGVTANTLPYISDFADVPEHKFEQNAEAAQMFEQFATQNFCMDDFAHTTYEDAYSKRRKAIIEKALAGETITVAAVPAAPAAVPDLMAAMKASLAQAGTKGATPVAA